jgi:hypothetical protein
MRNVTHPRVRAPIGRILPSFAPVLFERGIPGYDRSSMIPGESRIAPESLRALFIASAFLGTLNHAAERGLDADRVTDTLKQSIDEIPGVTRSEAQQAIDLVNRFYSFRIIREEHSFDDWLCEALWSTFQEVPYSYPSAMSAAISYGLTIGNSLKACVLEY